MLEAHPAKNNAILCRIEARIATFVPPLEQNSHGLIGFLPTEKKATGAINCIDLLS